jgi:hypothetical protein
MSEAKARRVRAELMETWQPTGTFPTTSRGEFFSLREKMARSARGGLAGITWRFGQSSPRGRGLWAHGRNFFRITCS